MKVRFLPLRQAYRRFSAGKSVEICPRLWETHCLQQPCDLDVVNKLRHRPVHTVQCWLVTMRTTGIYCLPGMCWALGQWERFQDDETSHCLGAAHKRLEETGTEIIIQQSQCRDRGGWMMARAWSHEKGKLACLGERGEDTGFWKEICLG